ncbi:PPW family C-terminal domain-containing PPE protein [Candidatus Mycobacterium methanotrophicum]|uniref:PPE-PPW subfamily C-terminal domain-containing protein n=1 Tax=Candidatus Mycobacterium methanotrophicum TaxID=2943498 RepID=A0ABY4QR18_9MYCO|nr:hypothetical protein M5I08_25200 [Candidatus Mycobacterium methanotrophicum]
MDLEPEPDGTSNRHEPTASAVASDRDAGPLGFAGAAPVDTAGPAAGLTTLPGDTFGGGPTMPMMPSTWGGDPQSPAGPPEGGDGR